MINAYVDSIYLYSNFFSRLYAESFYLICSCKNNNNLCCVKHYVIGMFSKIILNDCIMRLPINYNLDNESLQSLALIHVRLFPFAIKMWRSRFGLEFDVRNELDGISFVKTFDIRAFKLFENVISLRRAVKFIHLNLIHTMEQVGVVRILQSQKFSYVLIVRQ